MQRSDIFHRQLEYIINFLHFRARYISLARLGLLCFIQLKDLFLTVQKMHLLVLEGANQRRLQCFPIKALISRIEAIFLLMSMNAHFSLQNILFVQFCEELVYWLQVLQGGGFLVGFFRILDIAGVMLPSEQLVIFIGIKLAEEFLIKDVK